MNVPSAPTDEAPGQSQAVDTRLRGRFLVVARTTWVAVAVLSAGLFVAGIPAEVALLHVPCPTAVCSTGQLPPAGLRSLDDLGLSLDFFAAYTVAMDLLFAAVCGAVAALVFWRRSDDRMALFVSLTLLVFGTATFTFPMEALAARNNVWEVPAAFLYFLGSASFGLFLYLFPDGQFVPRWTRWVALAWIGWLSTRYFFPDWHLDPSTWPNLVNTAVWLGTLGTAIYSQIYRYRRASSPVQQQIKWVVFGISVALAGFIGIQLVLGTFAPAPTSPGALLAYLIGYTFASYLAVLLIPGTIGIAVLRHRLFDVDLVINRTLVYGAVTVSLGLVYLGSIVVLRTIVFGYEQPSQLAIVASTLTIAGLFNPFRRRIQAFMDRLFYRTKYDAAKTLESFSVRLRDETNLDRLIDELATVVSETIQPEHVSVWLRPSEGEPTGKAIRS